MVMALCLFTACGESAEEKMAKLCGTWTMTEAEDEELTEQILTNCDFYEEEIALANLTSLNFVQLVEFKEDGTYSYVYDIEATKAEARTFFKGVFDALYENRADIDKLYSDNLTDMSKDDFFAFYAKLYSHDTYDDLIFALADGAYTYDDMATPWEIGTFVIEDDLIMCTVDGKTEAEGMGYKIKDDTLTLTYTNGTEVYTRK